MHIKFMKSLIININQEEKNKNKINISLLEISDSDNFYYNNYENNDIQIVDYKNANANNIDRNSIEKYKKDLHSWIKENSKSKNVINIIIINFDIFNVYSLLIFYELENNVNKKKDYIIFYKEEFFIHIKHLVTSIEKIKIDKIKDILNLDIIKFNLKKQFMRKKLYLFMNYVGKLLENKIILNNDENNEHDNYLDELLIKINQEWAIYYNYDISEFNNNVIDGNKLKELINKIGSNINVSGFKKNIIDTIIKKLSKNLSFINEKHEPNLKDRINNIYEIKFKSEKLSFDNIFYKYFEKKYTIFKKKLKNDFIDKFLDKIKDKLNC